MTIVRKAIKYLGLIICVGLAAMLAWQRFSHPDMTAIRWMIEFWHIWLVWFVGTIVGCILYLYGNGDIERK